MVAGLSNQYINGVGKLNEDLLILIDIEGLMSSADMGLIEPTLH